ncbi:MAG: UDP-N-acetylenolpyruvoylglucosamine reductase [Deltaproteobacteria bacterium]|nr:MAG: UDP-N-acetylenolpyruvoylglucosamine reductase [Deltaproteobacteria bacterium]
MQIHTNMSLRSFNTFGVEVTAARYVGIDTEAEIDDAVGELDVSVGACTILGGGSNTLFVDNVPGTVLHLRIRGMDVVDDDGQDVWVRVMAGETWDDFVAVSVANGWSGIENLSLIPGSVGASAVQNVGAYGVEAGDVIHRVEVVRLASGEKFSLAGDECGFGYRFSHFKGCWAGRYLIRAVVFRLRRKPRWVLDYPGVADVVRTFGRPSLENIRRAIISIRREKLPDPKHIGNAGSFFKNPVVGADVFQNLIRNHADMPHYPQADGRIKLAAGWLIDHCGWKGRRAGQVAVHDRQALVLVNLGGATGQEILELSERIRRSVHERFGVRLDREVTVVP